MICFRNLEAERAKSCRRTQRAARKAKKEAAKVAQAGKAEPKVSKPNNPKSPMKKYYSSKVIFGEAKKEIWQQLTQFCSEPHWELYFSGRYKAHIEGVHEHGWDIILPIIEERINLLEECQQKARELLNIALSRVYAKGKNMAIFSRDIGAMLACEDEFKILMGTGLELYITMHREKGLGWQAYY
ncbi:hypothetical protein M422DRAFT_54176 [Sphaerobolus stellatus SS14]|uniref:Uncharacterized protein n=1 Tax=Sphaerobolus stellatus (strain SS14) TaxID=990650 RepID=A0A0C9UKN2_SPHS4|nr:hypothetical protein M422DRAFT_54176 [Sphaerobolus stellatus SS14]